MIDRSTNDGTECERGSDSLTCTSHEINSVYGSTARSEALNRKISSAVVQLSAVEVEALADWRSARPLVTLERNFHLETFAVPPDGCHCHRPAVAQEIHPTVARLQVSGELDSLPARGVTHVPDGHVVVCAPEERHRIEALLETQDIPSRRLPLAFGDHPVLDSNAFAAIPVGPTRNIPGCENVGRAGLEIFVD